MNEEKKSVKRNNWRAFKRKDESTESVHYFLFRKTENNYLHINETSKIVNIISNSEFEYNKKECLRSSPQKIRRVFEDIINELRT